MTPENFVYWLQGYLELTEINVLSEDQLKKIKEHIALVLKKETPIWIGSGTTLTIPPFGTPPYPITC